MAIMRVFDVGRESVIIVSNGLTRAEVAQIKSAMQHEALPH